MHGQVTMYFSPTIFRNCTHLTHQQQIGAGEDLVYADMYEDIKAGRVPDPRTTQPDLPPKKETVSTPPLPPKAPSRKGKK